MDTELYGYCLNDPINLIDPNGLIVEADPFNPSPNIPVPSEQLLSNTAVVAGIFATGLFITGDVPAASVFTGIGWFAAAMRNALYSDTPCNEAVKSAAKAFDPTPKPYDMITHELIDQGIDWYIDKYNLPKK